MINTCRESLSDLTPAENHNQTVLQKKADMEELEQLERTIVSGLETFKAVGLSSPHCNTCVAPDVRAVLI